MIHGNNVRSLRRRCGHKMYHTGKVAVGITSLADIVLLGTEGNGIDGQSITREEADLFAVFAQGEISVEIGWRAVGGGVIGPNQEINSGTDNRSSRQHPLLLFGQIIG